MDPACAGIPHQLTGGPYIGYRHMVKCMIHEIFGKLIFKEIIIMKVMITKNQTIVLAMVASLTVALSGCGGGGGGGG